ncbi:Rieske (2Fe-2S) protein [Litchfieldella rifensis]|uniref:Rieske (2Fe-2S) protein n=1 Tax=Litchfieldella rifensis TaxID=762643 RepID=A0ABV7LTJ4_9GAMM
MSALMIAHSSQLEDSGALGVTLPDGRAAFVVRVHGRSSAFENRCPHQGIGLEDKPDTFLEDGNELIQCRMHGALFLPESGECVFGPCLGRSLTPVPVSVDSEGNVYLARE